MSTKNSYAQKARKNQILSGIAATAASDKSLDTKERLKKSVAPTLVNTAVAIGGGFAGAAMGRLSLLTGLIVAGVGEYLGSAPTISFGLGMAVSNVASVAGLGSTENKGFIETAKERVKAYGKGIMEKLYLDKIIKKDESKETDSTSDQTTSGMGEVKYFSYPLKDKPDPVDLSELEKYEKIVEASAENFVKEKPAEGTDEENQQWRQNNPGEDQVMNELRGIYSDDIIL